MNTEICNGFKEQLIENTFSIVFENENKWKTTLNYLSYNPSHEIINSLSILNSRIAPTKVKNLSEWLKEYPKCVPTNKLSAIPLFDNKSEAHIAYDGWDISDINFEGQLPKSPLQIKDVLNTGERNPEYWISLIKEMMKENACFSGTKIHENKELLIFIETSILWAIDPVLEMQTKSSCALDTSLLTGMNLTNEVLLEIFSNITLILNRLPLYYKRTSIQDRATEERIEKDMEIWNRMGRTLPVRIQDAKNILVVQKGNQSGSSSSMNEMERNIYADEQLQEAFDGTTI